MSADLCESSLDSTDNDLSDRVFETDTLNGVIITEVLEVIRTVGVPKSWESASVEETMETF